MKKTLIAATALSLAFTPFVKAEYLFNGYIYSDTPTGIYDWNGFSSYGPEDALQGGGVNTPRYIDLDPGLPAAPTITQRSTGARLAGTEDGYGRIYSQYNPLDFVLDYQNGAPLSGQMLFQFQTSGALVDFSSIALQYTLGGTTYERSADEYIREYQAAGAPAGAGGFVFNMLNRVALSWDVSTLGAGVENFQIVWKGESIGMSFNDAILQSHTGPSAVAESRTWTATGTGRSWTDNSNWAEGSSSQNQGNIHFQSTAATGVILDSVRNVGEVTFHEPHNVRIDVEGAGKLGIYTGITTTHDATGRYEISGPVEFGALNLLQINAGEVAIEGPVAGDYGFVKLGEGTLQLSGNNTFGSGPKGGDVTLLGGVLEMGGQNQYTGTTYVIAGELRVQSDAVTNAAGALGNSNKAILIGAGYQQYEGGNYTAPSLLIDGDHTISRTVQFQGEGSMQKTFGAVNTTEGATYTGTLDLSRTITSPFENVHLIAKNAGDRFELTGAITGGRNTETLTIGGNGTVVYSGANKTYTNHTNIVSGTLLVSTGTSLTASPSVTVRNGATLIINGTLGTAGSATLTLENGATLGGSGTINRALTIGNGVTLAPGNSVGTINTVTQTWTNGGIFEFEIDDAGWDNVNITGDLIFSGPFTDGFKVDVIALTALLVEDHGAFDPNANNSWTFLTVSGSIQNFENALFNITGHGSFAGADFSVSQQGQNLVLNYAAPIPEPGTYALVGIGAALYAAHRRSRKAA